MEPTPALGLQALPGQSSTHAGQWLARVLPALVQDVLLFERQGFAAFQPRFALRDALLGRPVRLSDGQQGVADGVRTDGALWLKGLAGRIPVVQQEVSVRPC
jgi:BirA family biotin operon repressor/biotin-[acetyl-CoA-carboxylase] ligase